MNVDSPRHMALRAIFASNCKRGWARTFRHPVVVCANPSSILQKILIAPAFVSPDKQAANNAKGMQTSTHTKQMLKPVWADGHPSQVVVQNPRTEKLQRTAVVPRAASAPSWVVMEAFVVVAGR